MRLILFVPVLVFALLGACSQTGDRAPTAAELPSKQFSTVHLGPRPFYLVEQLAPSPLKRQLSACAANRRQYQPQNFSISHRGAPLQFPEHSVESYRAAARMGAGIIECDVTFTQDQQLVCRHSQCDLHQTTNILKTDLATTCRQPFQPATFNAAGDLISPAKAECCTSDISLAQFKTLRGKMEGVNSNATQIAEYLDGTPSYRTNLYSDGGTLVSHAESITLFKQLGVKMAPELKRALVPMPQDDFTQASYAETLVAEYRTAGINPSQVHLQSFAIADHQIWQASAPEFAQHAILLDGRDPLVMASDPPTQAEFQQVRAMGINYLAPRMATLLQLEDSGSDSMPSTLAPSEYAVRARAAGFKLIAWTTERSGRIDHEVNAAQGRGYYATSWQGLQGDGAILQTLDALATKVGVVGVFSDWPATTTFYANCTL